jgi:hypothetical protein
MNVKMEAVEAAHPLERDGEPKHLHLKSRLKPVNIYHEPSPLGQFWHINGCSKKEEFKPTGILNFLLESDDASLEDQLEFLERHKDEMAMAVFSGNKSIHFIFQAEWKNDGKRYGNWFFKKDEITDYPLLHRVLREKYPELNWDAACANINRMSRFPNAVRSSNFKRQKCLWYDPGRFAALGFERYERLRDALERKRAEDARKEAERYRFPRREEANALSFIKGYMRKHGLRPNQVGQRNLNCSKVRGALKKAGIRYSELDLKDAGFGDETIMGTRNLR